MIRRLLAVAALLPSPALAQPVPSPVIQPPGPGMVEAPCPKLPEPLTEAGWTALGNYNARYDWPWLCRYVAENAALKARPAVVFMGDSITEWWAQRDPSLFAAGTFAGLLVDRGISGQTTPQMVLRFRQDVLALRPRVVHIMGGTNDIAGNTGPESPAQFKDNIRTMVELARASRIRVVLGAIPPSSRFSWLPGFKPAPRIAELNLWLKGYAATNGLVFADYHGVLVGPDGGMKPGTSADGVHPDAAGYRLMRPVLERALAAAGVKTAAPAQGTPRTATRR